MPYKSKAERERERWMTLPEAVAHIRAADGCDEEAARRQIIKALANGVQVLGPLRWEKEKGDKPPPFGYTPTIVPSDTPPLGRDWLTAEIRWKSGRVRDDWGEYKLGKWRVLLILRAKVEQHWPLAPPLDAINKMRVAKQTSRRRSDSQRALALRALNALYGNDIPDRAGKSNQKLCGEVEDWLNDDRNWSKGESKRRVSHDTILRAAGRA